MSKTTTTHIKLDCQHMVHGELNCYIFLLMSSKELLYRGKEMYGMVRNIFQAMVQAMCSVKLNAGK